MLIRGELTVRSARTLLIADAIFGASAGVILVVGLLRVFYFEKGADYYFHNAPFLAKLALFAVIGLLSIIPTRQFLSWRRGLKQGVAPSVAPERLRSIRRVVHWELAGVVVLHLPARHHVEERAQRRTAEALACRAVGEIHRRGRWGRGGRIDEGGPAWHVGDYS